MTQRHEVAFVVDAPPHKVWRMFHPKPPTDVAVPRSFDHPNGSITILQEGNDDGQGLVRTCTFPVPKWLMTGGVARSWEVVMECRKNEYARYLAIGKPIWSQVEGWHTLESLNGGASTRLSFVEIYTAKNPISRLLFEKRVHHFISHDNTDTYMKVLGYLGNVTREK